MTNDTVINQFNNYKNDKVAKVINIEVKIVEKEDIKRSETAIRRVCLAAGILSAFFLKNQLSNQNFDLMGSIFGGLFMSAFLGVYVKKMGTKNEIEEELEVLKNKHKCERDNLDLEELELLKEKRMEFGLTKKRRK